MSAQKRRLLRESEVATVQLNKSRCRFSDRGNIGRSPCLKIMVSPVQIWVPHLKEPAKGPPSLSGP